MAGAVALLLAMPASASAAKVNVLGEPQADVLERGSLLVRVSAPQGTKVRLKGLLAEPGARPVRAFAKARTVGLIGGLSRRVELKLSDAGHSRLADLQRGCRDAVVRVVARIGGGRRSRSKGRARLARDEQICRASAPSGAPAPGGAGGGSPGGGGGPGPDPDPDPVPDPDPTSNVRAGAAGADITPPIGTPMFAYTARSGVANPDSLFQILGDPDENLYAKSFLPSEGIHTRVKARAIVLEQGERKFALVQTDLGGLPYALVQEVLRRTSATGITGERLLLSATHTHSSTGPIWPIDSLGYALLGGDIFDPRVFEITAQGISEAILAADSHLEQALVGVGAAELRGASNNRNFEPFRRNPDVPADEAGARAVSTNPELTVIRVDAVDGTPLGVWSNFAVHPTSFGDSNLLFSGDNPASAERAVERAITEDAEARGVAPPAERPVVDVWTNSAQGDVSPNSSPPNPDGEPLNYVPTSAAGANMTGLKVADGTLAAWRDAGTKMTGEPLLDARRTFMLFDGTQADGEPVGPLQALGAGGIVADDGVCAPFPLLPGQGNKFPAVTGIGLVPSSAAVSLWRLGSLGIASFPNEITTQMGRRITAAVEAEAGGALSNAVIAGLTNGYNSYTATPEEYDACHYEGSFTLFGRQQGGRWRDTASSLVDPLLAGLPANAGLEPPATGIVLPTIPPLLPTPDAGAAVTQPPDSLRRYERASFVWKGGDRSIDVERGRPFVSLQRLEGGDWVTVGTDDGPEDTTAHSADGNWTETWQFSNCDPVGTYRFHVDGNAIRALLGSQEGYALDSEPFELLPTAPLEVIDAVVDGTTARVRARYPSPGASLLALPRRVRSGSATITIREPDSTVRDLTADPNAERLAFTATVPAGSTIESVAVNDGCGNSS